MGSYVISVSAGTGCYRHIRISKSATLYQLHKAIICAFDFEDDHEHAFFMDNRYWSIDGSFFSSKVGTEGRVTKNYKLERLNLTKGKQFKYLFDYGDDWRFQCKVLRELADPTDIPCVIRSVGESPEQYPEPDRDEEDWEEDDDWEDEEDALDVSLSDEELDRLYAEIPLSESEISLLLQYMDAAARLYGLVPFGHLFDIYNSQNPEISIDAFLAVVEYAAHLESSYALIVRSDLLCEKPDHLLIAGEIAADYLFVGNPEEDIRALRRIQKGKPLRILPKEAFLRYAEPGYFPASPAREAMLKYLRRRAGGLTMSAEELCGCIQDVITIDAPFQEVVRLAGMEGLVFNKRWDIGEFAALFQDLNNNTHKHSNRGHSPEELSALHGNGKEQKEMISPLSQLRLLDQPAPKQNATISGTPSRNGPCPCGSGKKYKNCCGKNNK